ncbi:MAG: TIGR02206 family membrane protein [Gammaproteobacteria bacterium]|nr:TIGR02206 family membrane protein [Gammaproteobacteria bacterium]|tara:strand:+ start:64 stop:753 length:690 start_codon:yes stop_codon:yes gene_type:complete
MTPLNLLGTSHIIFTTICFAVIVLLPRLFIEKSDSSNFFLIATIISLMIINHGMDFYFEGYQDQLKLGLPIHLCDFSSAAIILYFFTKRREFFLFAFFAGISGAGMAILTPDSEYGFPNIHYVRHMIGHAMILLGVSYAIIIDNQRPYLEDVHKTLFILSLLLLLMYFVNYLLGPPANYWYVAEKPAGLNVTSFMRDAPYHMIDIYILAVIVCYLIYAFYYLIDKIKKN